MAGMAVVLDVIVTYTAAQENAVIRAAFRECFGIPTFNEAVMGVWTTELRSINFSVADGFDNLGKLIARFVGQVTNLGFSVGFEFSRPLIV